MIEIRKASSDDLQGLFLIEKECFGKEGVGLHALRQFLDILDGFIFVAEYEGGPVGYASGAPEALNSTKGWLLSLAVMPAFRQMGVGSRLTLSRADAFRSAGVRECRFTASPGNKASIDLHAKLGWVEECFEKDCYGPGKDRLVFCKAL